MFLQTSALNRQRILAKCADLDLRVQLFYRTTFSDPSNPVAVGTLYSGADSPNFPLTYVNLENLFELFFFHRHQQGECPLLVWYGRAECDRYFSTIAFPNLEELLEKKFGSQVHVGQFPLNSRREEAPEEEIWLEKFFAEKNQRDIEQLFVIAPTPLAYTDCEISQKRKQELAMRSDRIGKQMAAAAKKLPKDDCIEYIFEFLERNNAHCTDFNKNGCRVLAIDVYSKCPVSKLLCEPRFMAASILYLVLGYSECHPPLVRFSDYFGLSKFSLEVRITNVWILLAMS